MDTAKVEYGVSPDGDGPSLDGCDVALPRRLASPPAGLPCDEAPSAQGNLSARELEGGYHVLCAAVLAHTANLLGGFHPDGSSRRNHRLAGRPSRGKRKYFREEVAAQRFTAKQWVRGGGVLSFTECCEELGYSPAPARHTLLPIANGKP